jgi:hypothetical protein
MAFLQPSIPGPFPREHRFAVPGHYVLRSRSLNEAGQEATCEAMLEVRPIWRLRALGLAAIDLHGKSRQDVSVSPLERASFELTDSKGLSLGLERLVSDRLGVEVTVTASRLSAEMQYEVPGSPSPARQMASANLGAWAFTAGPNWHVAASPRIDASVGWFVGLGGHGSVSFPGIQRTPGSAVPRSLDRGRGFVWGASATAELGLRDSCWFALSRLRYAHQDIDRMTANSTEIGLGVGLRF